MPNRPHKRVTPPRRAAMAMRVSSARTKLSITDFTFPMKKIAALLAAVAMAVPATANPQFDTPAPVAYMVDLSSNAVLFSKDADRRMPPASLAKMMTVYVVFDMIKSGQLRADKQFTMSPETWKKWNNQGSTM